eukprot:TRINITY_DN6238_c0_g3_i1.p1 TRINITY_DN6238_c0_g3~~TRINITY_DN6238_c0_g3_i1.p1  ORF type:complete len:877 (+),score=203.00 TRINITY_DN6238_c0_g3_i1:111-2741(+)
MRTFWLGWLLGLVALTLLAAMWNVAPHFLWHQDAPPRRRVVVKLRSAKRPAERARQRTAGALGTPQPSASDQPAAGAAWSPSAVSSAAPLASAADATPTPPTATHAPAAVAATPQPSAAAATPEPSATAATPQPSAAEATPEPSAAAATPQPSTAAATSQPSVAAATPEPSAAAAPPPTASPSAALGGAQQAAAPQPTAAAPPSTPEPPAAKEAAVTEAPAAPPSQPQSAASAPAAVPPATSSAPAPSAAAASASPSPPAPASLAPSAAGAALAPAPAPTPTPPATAPTPTPPAPGTPPPPTPEGSAEESLVVSTTLADPPMTESQKKNMNKKKGARKGKGGIVIPLVRMPHTAYMEKHRDCPSGLRHPFTAHSTQHGVVALFPSNQGRQTRSLIQRESWWCSPWSDRGCGFSHAYTKQPPPDEEYKPFFFGRTAPHAVARLPHRAGGIPAAFDDWKTLVVGGNRSHPSARMLSAFVSHPGSFVHEKNKMVGHHHPTVVRGDASTGCRRTLAYALLWPLYVRPWAEHNYAHFLGDVWHWLFQLVDLYGRRTGLGPELPVIFFPENSTDRLSTFPRKTGFPAMVLRDIAPMLVAAGQLGEGRSCVRELFVDCPVPSVFRPYGAFQQHLTRRYGWIFTPHPADRQQNPVMLLLLRRPGGSRVLQNPQQVTDIAHEKGWCVRALRSDRARLSDIIEALQGSDALAAAHGAELAFMTFLRNASIVIEAIPELYADYDGYYVEQARAGALTLLRWRLPPSSVTYWGNQVPCTREGNRGPLGHSPCWCLVQWKPNVVLEWDVWRHRGMAGFVHFPAPTWTEVVRMAGESLPFPPPNSTCPGGAPNIYRLTGVPEITGTAMLHNHTRALRCSAKIFYPHWTAM